MDQRKNRNKEHRKKGGEGAPSLSPPQKRAALLAFDPQKDRAPRLLGKGEGSLASAIIKIANRSDVPIKEDPGLCSLLFAIPDGKEIPENLYRAVASIFALIYEADRKHAKEGQGRPTP